MSDAGDRRGPGDSGAEETADVPVRTAPADPHTLLIDRSAEAPPPSGIWLVFLLFAAAGFLIGIGIAAATRPKPPGAVVAEAMVGPDGASLGFGGKGVLRVPDGALSRPTRLEVRRSVVADRLRVNPPEGPLYVFERNELVAYTFTPTDTRFAEPVTIVLPLQRTGRGGKAFVVSGRSVVFLPGTVDAKSGTVTVKVTSFRFDAVGGAA